VRVAARTDTGQIRASNEDCYSAGELPGDVAWAVICDGMGGAAGGNIASRTAVKCIADAIVGAWQDDMGSRSIRHLLLTALDNANLRVFELSKANNDLSGMGTTVVAALITEQKAYVAHAGDSRAYICNGEHLAQITKDHSVVQAMLDNGQITEDEARAHPRRNLITRALGVYETLEVDYCEEELPEGSLLLVCTDGLTNAVSNEEIPAVLREVPFDLAADALVHRANQNGGPDNITVVLVKA
jgi:protein phosphatase